MLLQTVGLCKRFGGLPAINELNMHVHKDEIVGLIGPNGAGKSTLFNLVTGVLMPTSGKIYYDGVDITKKSPYAVAKLGIGRTFQLNPLFGDFTVLENVKTSFYLHPHTSMIEIFFSTRRHRRNEAFIHEQALEILEVVGLQDVPNELAKNLPHGYQKMLGVARALATQPSMLLLDEPLGGMNPGEIDFSLKAIASMRAQGKTVLIVEHNMQVLDICDRVVVISFGEQISEGTPAEVRADKNVIATYLGGGKRC